MLTISKPLSAAQLRTYHAEEFSSAEGNYYTNDTRIHGRWNGRLAELWGLVGEVSQDHVDRLSEGQHPMTGEQLVRHRFTRALDSNSATEGHRAGWDATFSAPKSVSLTALVGGDERVTAAHRASVRVALDELERFTQARIGGDRPAETTGRWVAAMFEHDSARPVDGYAAPQLHTHAVVFNVTTREDGDARALQPRELYRSQQLVTAVYRSELAHRLVNLGYEIERGSSGQPEIAGYTPEYLEASSPRRQQIKEELQREQHTSAAAAQIAAHRTREPKLYGNHEDMRTRHRVMAEAFGNQPSKVIALARERGPAYEQSGQVVTSTDAISYARDRNFEREAVVDERTLFRDALARSMGDQRLPAIREELSRQVDAAEFLIRPVPAGAAGRSFTTNEMVDLERHVIDRMLAGRHTHEPLVHSGTREQVLATHSHLSQAQKTAVQQILENRDQVSALEGVAGSGKTTTLVAIREAAERDGYDVRGLAPTSRATQKVAEAGIESVTLQRHLLQPSNHEEPHRRLYILDESSLASTRQMHAFLMTLHAEDRVLLVGDTRQHHAVEAGQPFQQLQSAGMDVVRLDAIVRQQDPALKQVVEHLARGEMSHAVRGLDEQGRLHEVRDRSSRFAALTQELMQAPQATLVVSPDNQSRVELNQVIRGAMQAAGQVDRYEHQVRVLVPRHDVTAADRLWPARYEPGNVVRYAHGSAKFGLHGGEYVHVTSVSPSESIVTVSRLDGTQVTYNPERLRGVTLYREAERAFAAGDRVQFTLASRPLRVANRELGTLERIEPSGAFRVRLDSGRHVSFLPRDHPHIDHGYAVTSHSGQGQTADRVLVHVDTTLSDQLVNRRLAYVAISRGRFDAQVFTDNRSRLEHVLSRDVQHESALSPNEGRLRNELASGTTSAAASRTANGISQAL